MIQTRFVYYNFIEDEILVTWLVKPMPKWVESYGYFYVGRF